MMQGGNSIWVLVASVSSMCWDDGIDQICGPFQSEEEANEFARKNPHPTEWEAFPVKSPTSFIWLTSG